MSRGGDAAPLLEEQVAMKFFMKALVFCGVSFLTWIATHSILAQQRAKSRAKPAPSAPAAVAPTVSTTIRLAEGNIDHAPVPLGQPGMISEAHMRGGEIAIEGGRRDGLRPCLAVGLATGGHPSSGDSGLWIASGTPSRAASTTIRSSRSRRMANGRSTSGTRCRFPRTPIELNWSSIACIPARTRLSSTTRPGPGVIKSSGSSSIRSLDEDLHSGETPAQPAGVFHAPFSRPARPIRIRAWDS